MREELIRTLRARPSHTRGRRRDLFSRNTYNLRVFPTVETEKFENKNYSIATNAERERQAIIVRSFAWYTRISAQVTG